MVNRRKMFGDIASSPVIASGIVLAHANEDLEPEHNIIQLQAQRQRHMSSFNNTLTLSGFEGYGPILGISVGRDGNMWVKVDNKWKRVVTE